MIKLFRDPRICPPEARGAVATLGNFDGVHLGHRMILNTLITQAKALHAPSLVITFEPHPHVTLRPELRKGRLSPFRDKVKLLDKAGIDYALFLRFDARFSEMSATDFIETILHNQLGIKHMVVGHDLLFGKGRQGNAALLTEIGARLGFGVSECQAQHTADGQLISSTAIRRKLEQGDIESANHLLGYPFTLTGRVRHGKQQGSLIGFPTANIALNEAAHPLYGVYAVTVQVEGEKNWYQGVANIGIRPTFTDSTPMLEVHLFDMTRDLYGKRIRVLLHHFIRPEKRFDGLDALKQQIAADIISARASFDLHSVREPGHA